MNKPIGRRPGPGTSRPAILAATRDIVAEVGVERASMRAIAARADVDPAAIYRFFDSKDELIAAALRPPDIATQVAAGLTASDDPARALVGGVLFAWEVPEVRAHLTALMRAAFTNDRAAELLRGVFTEQIVGAVQSAAHPDDSALRASLAASQVIGLALLREILGIEPLANESTERLVDVTAPTIERYLEGELSKPES
ncbi:MAG: TetR family transcriptional regulator [Actinomycetota bacterium]